VTAAEDQPSVGSRAAAGRSDGENDGQATERVVIRDRRKIDPKAEAESKTAATKDKPVGGAHRAAEPDEAVPDDEAVAQVTALGAELSALRTELEERTHDLQRVTAEYANYRKRVDRDREKAAENTIGVVLTSLLPVLDDIDRAREHGDLVGPFASVAESLTAVSGKLGLTGFGEKGDPFDPNRHEAVAHLTSGDVTEPTCVEVMRRGYILGERLLRPALVAVADPE
jgi:molecular chaperone GrpE